MQFVEFEMNINNIIQSFIISGSLLLFVDCAIPHAVATAPMASASRDIETKNFVHSPDKAVIYIYRDEYAAYYVFMGILVDKQPIARTVSWSYLRLELSPGHHEITSRAEKDNEFAFQAEAGKLYFLRQVVMPGIKLPRSKLVSVSENDGRTGVNKCKLLDVPTTVPE